MIVADGGENYPTRVHAEGQYNDGVAALLHGVHALEPAGRDPVVVHDLVHLLPIALVQVHEGLGFEQVVALRPADTRQLPKLMQQTLAVATLPESVIEAVVAARDVLHELLQAQRALQPHPLARVPLEVARGQWVHLQEAEHCAQQDLCRAQAHDAVVPQDRAVHVHEDDQLLARPGVSLYDAGEVVLVRDGLEDVRLDQHVLVLRAVVNEGVLKGSLLLEAVTTLGEVDVASGRGVQEVADALGLRIAHVGIC
mmetsp:Transcript_24641/g.73281  ORF Transcript_24641/g.73281 Transcript_24641/m.73281 type:complete len:254 (+) Transcript_24641:424-1185(+)